MWYKIKKIYQWTNLVRPMTYTYTITSVPSSGSSYYSIAKSWYKIKQVVIEWSTSYNSQQYCWAYPKITYTTNRTYEAWLSFNYGSVSTDVSYVMYRQNNTNYKEYTYPKALINYSWTNTFKMTLTKTWWTTIVNGTTNTGTYGSAMSTVVNNIFNSWNSQCICWNVDSTIPSVTFTVTYESA